MVTGGQIDVFHPGIQCHVRDKIGIKLLCGEPFGELLVFLDPYFATELDPFSRTLLVLPKSFQKTVQAVMDEKPKLCITEVVQSRRGFPAYRSSYPFR